MPRGCSQSEEEDASCWWGQSILILSSYMGLGYTPLVWDICSHLSSQPPGSCGINGRTKVELRVCAAVSVRGFLGGRGGYYNEYL